MRYAMPPRGTLPCADGWAILADPPGSRDLGQDGYWRASLERSRRRRDVRREPRIVTRGRAKVSLALTAVAVGGPAGGIASAQASSSSQVAALGVSNLSVGSSGSAVAELQRRLGISADGIFGPQTEAAVQSFQRAHGIPSTGLVGPLTRAALGTSASSSSSSSSSSGVTATGLPSSTIRAMQSALGVSADGVVGPQTRAALRSFEAAHGLTVDGQPGPATLSALGVSSSGTSTPGSAGTTTTTAGAPSSSAAQTAVQAALSKAGDPYSYGAAGPSSFDCSGLVMWAFRQAGVSLPHSSYAQYGMGTPVTAIQAGDLVFFNTAGGGASDVGIATSADTAVSATTHGVMTHSIRSGYWGEHFVGARRL